MAAIHHILWHHVAYITGIASVQIRGFHVNLVGAYAACCRTAIATRIVWRSRVIHTAMTRRATRRPADFNLTIHVLQWVDDLQIRIDDIGVTIDTARSAR